MRRNSNGETSAEVEAGGERSLVAGEREVGVEEFDFNDGRGRDFLHDFVKQ